MSWRDSMRAAKFRTAEFYIDDSERAGGRRGVTHEYPKRDNPFHEDLGRKARSFHVEAHVIGDDYFAKRDALCAALEEFGPGELQHPYWGTRTVAVQDFSVKETTRDGGIATFSIQFVETSAKPVLPSVSVDSAGKLTATAALTRTAVGSEFTAKYSPGTRLESITGALSAATDAMAGAANKLRMSTQDIATVTAKIATLKASFTSLINAPADLLVSLSDLVTTLANAADLSVIPTAILRGLYALDFGERPPSTTANRVQEQVNFDALCTLIQRLVLVSAVELSSAQTYDSFEAAVTERDALSELIDEQVDTAADDAYPSLQQLRADLVKAVPGDDSDLPHLVNYTPSYNVPSLVLAHRLYGSVDSELDLTARNNIRRPGFISGNQALEVLSSE